MKNNIDYSNSKRAIVVTPVYKENISNEEMVSIIFAQKYLQEYDKVVVAPEKLSKKDSFIKFWQDNGYKIVFFENKYFNGLSGYNKFMVSVEFYQHFIEYEYILIYQLDALILSNTLKEWLNKNVDYVAPPWISEGERLKLESVGNGGFSLRRVQAFIDVLESKDFFPDNRTFKSIPARAGIINLVFFKLLILTSPYLKKLNRRALFLFFFGSNEDLFWSFFAKYFTENFTVSDADEALKFAFELYPEFCYEENQHELPLGVHAWFKHDPSFWVGQFPELESYVPVNRKKL